jgi:hypothetical protein
MAVAWLQTCEYDTVMGEGATGSLVVRSIAAITTTLLGVTKPWPRYK